MPPDTRPIDGLDEPLAALAPALGIAPTPQERAQLLAYLGLIQRWNMVYNLTAVRDPAEMLTHHLLDCLAIVNPLSEALAGRSMPPRVLDVGSGAGLPGIVLAILRPDWQITCVDAAAKKASFIRQVAGELALPHLQALHGRVEVDADFHDRYFDLIVSRAFGSLADFVELSRHRLAPNGLWAAMKAHLLDEERADLPRNVELFHVEPLEVPGLHATRCLVWLKPVDERAEVASQPRQ